MSAAPASRHELFPLGPDATSYRKLTSDGIIWGTDVADVPDARHAVGRVGGLGLLDEASDGSAQDDLAVEHLDGDLIRMHRRTVGERLLDCALEV